MHNNGLLTSWDAFLRALELRFAPSKFKDPIAALCKLSQTQLLQDYITEFESIANRISGYPASFYLSCFISGLKPHLRREVTALQPTDMPQAVAFAKLHDTQTASPLLPTPSTKIPIKRLTEAEMQDRRDKNLCYNCDERYTRGHRCKSQFLLLVVPAADNISDSLPDGSINLHSLSGQWTPQTFRITGSLKEYEVHIMVDSGATHNFIQSKVAHFLNLPLEPTLSPLKVMVGNGDFLPCTTYCPQAQITLASLKFPIDLYPLDLSGTDIVPIPITAHQLRRLHHTNRVEALFQLILEPSSPTLPLPPQTQQPQTNSTIPSIAPPPFQSLLIKYCTLFTTPTSLPPSRSTDHSIPLLPNTPPISVRPYHYPHFQKQEIKTQVAKMLESGFITPNISPFSSPVLLVKKKDGTWRFCVDYRALNPATVKDKFPIPTVDELLDELGHASWFSKLDLFSGFHQILMVPSDSKKTAFRTHNSHFEFKVMPFGLCNAPSTFQATMNDLLRPHLRRFIIIFFQNCFHLNDSKCSIGQQSIHYLGVSARSPG
uniref:Transposon Ty3-I Gag-Pol polyprotein n=1 Tax=Cajanus cajan TaxID=3821 RepID=A0A151TB10_CAJCA|nr:Transposon Ty3-I Gag-Pol polyprotein [Cajanus cajan]